MDERPGVKGQGRLAAATRHLADEALDGLIAASNGLNNFLESNAVYVFSGVRPIGESAVVLDREGSSTLIVTPAWDEERAARLSSNDTDHRNQRSRRCARERGQNAPSGYVAYGRRSGCPCSGRGSSIASRRRSALCRNPPMNWRANLRECARADELAAAERATWIAERGYERLLEYAGPGMREYRTRRRALLLHEKTRRRG